MQDATQPKCSNPECDCVDFKVELNKYVGDINGDIFQFVYCKECGTTVGTLPYTPKD